MLRLKAQEGLVVLNIILHRLDVKRIPEQLLNASFTKSDPLSSTWNTKFTWWNRLTIFPFPEVPLPPDVS